jgi:hypothetical protein
MKVFVVVLIVSAVWMMLAFVLAGCGGRKAAPHAMPPSFPSAGTAPWMWEQHGTVVSLRQTAEMPPSHPVARVL